MRRPFAVGSIAVWLSLTAWLLAEEAPGRRRPARGGAAAERGADPAGARAPRPATPADADDDEDQGPAGQVLPKDAPKWLPQPPPFEPVIVEGKAWTFHTPPPPKDQRRIEPTHPRLWVTRKTLPALREKLLDPAYKADLASLRAMAPGDAAVSALLYHLEIGEKEAHKKTARELLLAGKFPNWTGPGDLALCAAAMAYDWGADLLSAEEKKQVFARLKGRVGTVPGHHAWYENDCYARGGVPYRPLVALAGFGDGADDEWCRRTLETAYDVETTHAVFRGPYGAARGQGYLDVLNSMALDTGGSQAGNHGDDPISGYTSMFYSGPPLVLPAWQTATGEKVLERCNFLRLMPHWLAYEADPWAFKSGKQAFHYAPRACAALEIVGGQYKDIDPDMAALAVWQVKTYGRDKYTLVPRVVLGDMRIKPRSPQELGLPTAAYLRGADCFFSRSSWAPDAAHVRFQIRYLDTNRYEEHNNVFTITKCGYVAPGGRVGKGTRNPGNHSGLWFYEPGGGGEMPNRQQGSTYWSGLQYKPGRATSPLAVVTNPAYHAGGPVAVGVHEGYRFATGDATRLMWSPKAVRYVRTLAHLLPLGENREFVLIHDRTEAQDGVKRVWGLRTLDEPLSAAAPSRPEKGHAVFGGAREFTIVNRMGNCHGAMHMTVVLPEKTLSDWRGGLNLEGVTPEGKRYLTEQGRHKAGFANNDPLRYKYGIGNLYIQAERTEKRQNYLMVMQLGDANTFNPAGAAGGPTQPALAKAKAAVVKLAGPGSDAVQFDEWVAVFSTDPGRRTGATYTLAADGAARHVVFDLAPGTYTVKKSDAVIAQAVEVKDKDFSLSFKADGKKGEAFTIVAGK